MEIINAIVLKSTDYKDNDKIVTLFSAERGKVTVNVKGVKKAGAKLKFCVQPFCFAEYVLAEKNGRYTVTQSTLYDSFFDLSGNLQKYYAGIAVLDFLNSFVLENEESGELFALTVTSLKRLAYENLSPKLVLVRFLVDALKICGFGFVTDGCGNCGKEIKDRVFLDSVSGACLCEDCKKEGDIEFSVKTYRFIEKVSRAENLGETECDELILKKALKLLSYYMFIDTETESETLNKIIKSDF